MTITPESVQELLSSEDYGDRLSGINKLRQLDTKIAFELVKPMVTDANTRVRYAAVSQLDTLGKEDLQTSLEILRDRLLNDSEADVKAAAADAIGGLKLTAAFDELETLYHQTNDWIIQLSILAALGELGDPRGFELLKTALNSDNTLIKTTAISALGELGNLEAISILVPFADDPDWEIRYRLTQALANLGGDRAHSTLQKLAKDSSSQVAEAALTYLKS